MLHRVLRRTPIAALCAAALVVGCSKGDKNADSAMKLTVHLFGRNPAIEGGRTIHVPAIAQYGRIIIRPSSILRFHQSSEL